MLEMVGRHIPRPSVPIQQGIHTSRRALRQAGTAMQHNKPTAALNNKPTTALNEFHESQI
jgi:hypothetical protein